MVHGSIVAIVTPLHPNGDVNYEKLTELLEWHIAHHTDGIVILGTTGEASTLSKDEKLTVFSHTVSVVNHRIPVIAGTGSNSTQDTIEFSQQVEALGVDGLLIVTPYYNKSNKEGFVAHYTMIADQVNIPIIMYNVPSRTGVMLPVEVVSTLSKHPNIVGLKEASGDLSYAITVRQQTPDDFLLYSGNDDVIVPLLAIGGAGVISVAANIIPDIMHDIVASFFAGDITTARNLQLQYLPLIHSLFLETNPIPVKEAMNHMGFNVGGFRMPLYPLSAPAREELIATLEAYQL